MKSGRAVGLKPLCTGSVSGLHEDKKNTPGYLVMPEPFGWFISQNSDYLRPC